jgi:hypothetical protein
MIPITQYTVDDYNVTVFRGHVREDGRILHGIRSDGVLEWRLPNAFKNHEKNRRKRNSERRARRKRWLDKYKLHKGCSVCGKKDMHPWLLQMDHIDPSTKKANVGDLATGSLKKLMAEVRKCRIVCFPCHVNHTTKQNKIEEVT